jgi:hypothetical protein
MKAYVYIIKHKNNLLVHRDVVRREIFIKRDGVWGIVAVIDLEQDREI